MLARRSTRLARIVQLHARCYAYNPFVQEPNPERSMERDVERGNLEREQNLGEIDDNAAAEGNGIPRTDFYNMYKDLS